MRDRSGADWSLSYSSILGAGGIECKKKGLCMRPQFVSWEQALKYVYKSDTLFVDLRDKEEYDLGHVTGAWNIPYEKLEEHWDDFGGYERVVFYCDRGNHSLSAARILARRGQQSYSVAGGYDAPERREVLSKRY